MLFTLFATLWQAANGQDWNSRLQAEQQWLLQSLAPPALQEETVVEDSISTGQAAPVRQEPEPLQLENPWGPDAQGSQYQPARKRSR